MILGHSFRLAPVAIEQLRQSSAEMFNRLYSDMAFGVSPGFVCSCCGFGLDDYCRALALSMIAIGVEPQLHWTTQDLLGYALHLPCEPRGAVTTAALRGLSGTPAYDGLAITSGTPTYTTLRAVIGVALDRSIHATNEGPPALQRRH